MAAIKPRAHDYQCGIMYRKVNGRQLICGRPARHQGQCNQRMTLRELMASLRPRPRRS